MVNNRAAVAGASEHSGKPLSEVPYEAIVIGMQVISAIGSSGKVTKKISPGHRNEDNDIEIEWDNGKVSNQWHFRMDKVTVK